MERPSKNAKTYHALFLHRPRPRARDTGLRGPHGCRRRPVFHRPRTVRGEPWALGVRVRYAFLVIALDAPRLLVVLLLLLLLLLRQDWGRWACGGRGPMGRAAPGASWGGRRRGGGGDGCGHRIGECGGALRFGEFFELFLWGEAR